ncbi:MAG: type I DNA topoisomerase [Oscillospiraceae bacterium]|nr:type I DNA topoisomerase [Oscillospiraceae bacterium]
MSTLIIVESPVKAKTIKKYLGKNYQVIASNGHIRDLPKSTLGVDVENDFEPKYITIRGKAEIVKKLKDKQKKSTKIYLATDPDREGEAISWHIANLLKLDISEPIRVSFNEITEFGVKSGMSNPRKIDINLVEAQQTRRIFDRIVGYKLSPFLWKKIRKGLSAGRVQSVAVKMIVEREREIKSFIPVEYWSINALLISKKSKKAFEAVLNSIDNKKPEILNKDQADQILNDIKDSDFIVEKIKTGVRKSRPLPPFTTSTLQQDASNKLGFRAAKTMKAAQELYEGREVDGIGAIGLITYMRTDSLRVSIEAQNQARDFIKDKFGPEYIPEKNNVYKSKSSAQDAHEAIRPTVPSITPEIAKSSLTSDQYKIYNLIWTRFMASQMSEALYDTMSVDIKVKNKYNFRSTGRVLKFAGYTVVYKSSEDTDKNLLPKIEEGEILKTKEVVGNQHFTQPPARFTEASLIKSLEENGIGRPSTYAPTISTIMQREYIVRESKQLVPTDLGEIVSDLIDVNFNNIINIKFTAKMEDELDMIADGSLNWKQALRVFYDDFLKTLDKANQNDDGKKILVPSEQTDIKCELCGSPMAIKVGRFGKFLACTNFPECRNTKKIEKETNGKCPICGGRILVKTSKNKKTYYGCENLPECNFMTWDLPVSDICPKCGNTLFKKKGKKEKIYCLKEGCGYSK